MRLKSISIERLYEPHRYGDNDDTKIVLLLAMFCPPMKNLSHFVQSCLLGYTAV
jgi:hypothetical protein